MTSRSWRPVPALGYFGVLGYFGMVGACALVACSIPPRQTPAAPSDPPERERPARDVFAAAELEPGHELYLAHCAVCHGDDGAGDGPASPFLFPEPRDFTHGLFRLVSTDNGVPSERDLVTTLARGIPGSAMPAWHWLEEAELRDLAAHVRRLAQRGIALRSMSRGTPKAEALALAAERVEPGDVLPVVQRRPPESVVLDHGRDLYLVHCAVCHDSDGTGREEPRFDEDGSLNWPRDFTAGFLKGGASPADLGWRIQAGLPGSAMPATELETSELEALVAYVGSLLDEDAAMHLVHHKERIGAAYVTELPAGPDDERWATLDEVHVVLSPLFAPDLEERIVGARVAACHDGESVAIRVRWRDASQDLQLMSDVWHPDAAALQFSEAEAPPLFGMGSSAHPTNIWHWKSLRLIDVAGALDLFQPAPHATARSFRGEVRADVPLYRPASALPPASETVESLAATGVGRVDASEDVGGVVASPVWSKGEWRVQFTRSAVPTTEDEVALFPGASVNLALAIWNGSAADRGARKSISIWQVLELEPEPARELGRVAPPAR